MLLQATGAALMADTVPPDWDRHWEGPSSPADYCRAAVARASALETWLSRSQAGQLLGSFSCQPLQLCQLLNPGTMLNALRQQTARLLGRPIDELQLATTWDARQLPGSCPLVVQLGGLLIQGAAFDGARLTAAAQVGCWIFSAPIQDACCTWLWHAEHMQAGQGLSALHVARLLKSSCLQQSRPPSFLLDLHASLQPVGVPEDHV